MNHDMGNVGWPDTFPLGKIYWQKYWEKINIDIVNQEKLFDRSADHK